jgi:hypothetical protein
MFRSAFQQFNSIESINQAIDQAMNHLLSLAGTAGLSGLGNTDEHEMDLRAAIGCNLGTEICSNQRDGIEISPEFARLSPCLVQPTITTAGQLRFGIADRTIDLSLPLDPID